MSIKSQFASLFLSLSLMLFCSVAFVGAAMADKIGRGKTDFEDRVFRAD
jgi:hypothetical protein